MSRANEKDGVLRKCPTCETPVAKAVNLGLKDFAWANEKLPGKLGLMDFDGVLSRSGGRFLVLEFKPKAARVSIGARLTFGTLVSTGLFDVWVMWDLGNGRVKVGQCNDKGRTPTVKEYTLGQAGNMVAKWWEENSR